MFFYLLLFIIGACVGSFLNVVILRLPQKKSIVKESSHCPNCQKKLKAYDLIPVISFFLLGAKCRNCQKKISWQYPIVELVCAGLFIFLGYHYQILTNFANPIFYRDLVFVSTLLIIFVTDLKYYLIFDAVTVPLMIFAFLINFFILSNSNNYWSVFINLIVSAVIGGGFFLLQYIVSKGKWIGGGDIRLGFLMGFMLGWPMILVALVIAYLVGAIISIFLVIGKKKKMKSEVPFGVFLSFATFVVLIWGNQILNWYLTQLGI